MSRSISGMRKAKHTAVACSTFSLGMFAEPWNAGEANRSTACLRRRRAAFCPERAGAAFVTCRAGQIGTALRLRQPKPSAALLCRERIRQQRAYCCGSTRRIRGRPGQVACVAPRCRRDQGSEREPRQTKSSHAIPRVEAICFVGMMVLQSRSSPPIWGVPINASARSDGVRTEPSTIRRQLIWHARAAKQRNEVCLPVLSCLCEHAL